jgi:hypothetical protein
MSDNTQPTPLDRARELIELRARATQGHFVADANIYGTGKYICCERGAVPIGDRIAEVLEARAGLDSNQAMANAIMLAHAANHGVEVAQAYIDAEKRVAELVEERDYWRTIAQEGVGGLPLEDVNNDA